MSFVNNIPIFENLKLNSRQITTIVILVIMLLAVPALFVSTIIHSDMTGPQSSSSISVSQSSGGSQTYYIPDSIGQVVTSGYSSAVAVDPTMPLTVLVSLQFNNPTMLSNYLTDVQTPGTSQFHNYLTREQFSELFSPSASTYLSFVNYFTQKGLGVSTYRDRVSMKLTGTVDQFEKVFNTKIMNLQMNSMSFYAPVKSLSLNINTNSISAVIGLNNYFKAQTYSSMTTTQPYNATFVIGTCSSTDPYCSNQDLYGSDLQTAYQVNQLFSSTNYPYNKTIATILWAGTNSAGTNVAPFVPSDISSYFANTLPTGQPRPNVCGTYNQTIQQSYICGQPVDGAPNPGTNAYTDTSNAYQESTLDLEMAGSTAPGANVIEVYGPGPYSNYMDDAFAAILNAPPTNPLYHTVAISNSWGSPDEPGPWGAVIDPLWQQYTQEAAALGITVLASSGDSANKNGQTPGWPASVAYDNYGVISVGGTQTELSGTASSDSTGTTGIFNQTVWFSEPSSSSGSQGGVSGSYPEPIWQKQSFDANNVITSSEPQISGRGNPDISAVGSNMLVYMTSSSGTASYSTFYGTSVASPLVAGVVAVMDWYLGSNEGYFNPLIYQLGQDQFDGFFGAIKPFSDVIYWSNYIFTALPGYDLVTGWGSINAYNFIQDQSAIKTITFTEIGLTTGTLWSVTLDNGATQTSYTNTIIFLAENGNHPYIINNVMGQFSNVTQGTAIMQGFDITVSIAFSSPTSSGSGINKIIAANEISNSGVINFTISGSSVPNSDLPIAENISIASDTLVNTISLYLNGTGQVAVSIGTNPWQADVLAPITINVNGVNWYNVTFPVVKLVSSVDFYYINVWIANHNYSTISWGYINDASVYTPTVSIGDHGSLSNMSLSFPYNSYTSNTKYPAIYTLGLNTQPPAIIGSSNITLAIINSDTISWKISGTVDNYGLQYYTIYKNGIAISSGTWTSNNNITLTSKESDPGLFNYTLKVSDAIGGYALDTVWVNVTGTSNGTYTSTVTNTVTSSTTSTVTVPSVSTSTQTSTVTNTQGGGQTTTQTSTKTVTESSTVNSGSNSSIKTSPGFEIIPVLVVLFLLVPFFLRRRKINK